MKKFICSKQKLKYFFENEIFVKIIPPPPRHIKYKVIDFAPINKNSVANNFLLMMCKTD